MPEENTPLTMADIVNDIDAAVDETFDPNGESQLELDLAQSQDETKATTNDVPEQDSEVDEQPQDADQASDAEEVQPAISESERAAREKGWRPKEEFEGNAAEWVDHEEFHRRTPLFDKISKQNKTLKDLNAKIIALVEHNQNLEKRTREKVLAELKQQRKEAVQYGDTEAFDEVEKRIEEVQAEELSLKIDDEPAAPAEPVQEIPQPIKDFAERNDSWFEKDKEMTDYAVYKVQSLTNQGIAINDALEQAEAAVKATFAAKLAPAASRTNPNKSRPSPVLSGSTESRPKGKQFSDLTSDQKQVWYAMKNSGMSLADFMKQIED